MRSHYAMNRRERLPCDCDAWRAGKCLYMGVENPNPREPCDYLRQQKPYRRPRIR